MHQNSVSARLAVPEDLEQIVLIENACYPEPWSMAHFAEELRKPYSRVLVLTDDETDTVVLGFMIYWVQAERVSLLNLAVDPKWRGLGLARKLLHLMINEAVRDEIPKISLEVRVSNTAAISLYQSIGFKKIHERPKFYSNGEAALVMEIKSSDINPQIH